MADSGLRQDDDKARVYIPSHLDAELGGSLPCVVCGYELKGLSIRGVCPECGTAVRATILYKVDPRAEEFQPIRWAKLRAMCLVMWPIGAIIAAGAFWTMRIIDLAEGSAAATPNHQPWLGSIAVLATMLSGFSLLPLLHPSRGTPMWKAAFAAVAVLAYAPLVWLLREIIARDAAQTVSLPYIGTPQDPQRHVLRLFAGACCIVILLGFRPIARELVRRSLALRTGRVDRQTLFGMAAVFVLIGLGDVLAIAGASRTAGVAALPLISTVIIGVGSVIITLGLISALLDSARIAKAIVTPSPSLRQVIEGETASPVRSAPRGPQP